MVRRDDCAWGYTEDEVHFANSDTFYWTNCSPQHRYFNRDSGVWGNLERHIAREADDVGDKLVVYAGPVLDYSRGAPHDFGGGRFWIPFDFWKVVVVSEHRRTRRRLSAYGFLMEQESVIDRRGMEGLSFDERFNVGRFRAQQRPLVEITKRTGVVFPENVMTADVLKSEEQEMAVMLESFDDLKL